MTVSYLPLLRAQSKRIRPEAVAGYTSADSLIAAQQRAHARLMGIAGGEEPKRKLQALIRPHQRKRDILDVSSTPVPVDKVQPFPMVFPESHWRVICRDVCKKYDIKMVDLMSIRRAQPIVRARYEAFYRMRNETTLSLPQIGKRLGGRDHTTVLHGIRVHQRRLAEAASE